MPSSRLAVAGVAAAMVVAVQPGAAQAVLGPDAAACRNGSRQAAVLVNVRGFREQRGNLRVQLYNDDADEFLAPGRYLRRIDLPVSRAAMPVCVALPRPGRYAVAVRHDEDGDGRTSWSDGGGFSRNPHLSLAAPRPSHSDVAIGVGRGTQRVDVVLNYRFGLVIRPVAGR